MKNVYIRGVLVMISQLLAQMLSAVYVMGRTKMSVWFCSDLYVQFYTSCLDNCPNGYKEKTFDFLPSHRICVPAEDLSTRDNP